MEHLVIFVLGLLVGFVGRSIFTRIQKDGFLRIDRSDPNDNPYLFLELSNAIDTVSRKKFVTFEVSNKNYIPRD